MNSEEEYKYKNILDFILLRASETVNCGILGAGFLYLGINLYEKNCLLGWLSVIGYILIFSTAAIRCFLECKSFYKQRQSYFERFSVLIIGFYITAGLVAVLFITLNPLLDAFRNI